MSKTLAQQQQLPEFLALEVNKTRVGKDMCPNVPLMYMSITLIRNVTQTVYFTYEKLKLMHCKCIIVYEEKGLPIVKANRHCIMLASRYLLASRLQSLQRPNISCQQLQNSHSVALGFNECRLNS